MISAVKVRSGVIVRAPQLRALDVLPVPITQATGAFLDHDAWPCPCASSHAIMPF